MNTAMQQMGTRISQQMESAIQKNIAQLGSQMENALKIDASAFQNAIHMNMTQEELADRAELSKGFISQVERDLTSPSIATLMDILQCLGSTIGEFFNEAPEEQIVFEKNDYFIKKIRN